MPATVCAQAVVNDTTRAHNIKEVVVKANRGARAVGMIKQTAEQLKVEMPADMTDLVRYMPSVGEVSQLVAVAAGNHEQRFPLFPQGCCPSDERP